MAKIELDSSALNEHFTHKLLAWFVEHGRHDLPWQHPRTAYRVWISEIMLQQTQVKTVIAYFERFMERFPTLNALAIACDDEVLAVWSGLGYYTRARNVHRTARIIEDQYGGVWPTTRDALAALPGIGLSTAAAIASQAFNQPTAILDANAVRVLSRYFLIKGATNSTAVKVRLWQQAQACMSTTHCADYTQAIMDLGATCCTRRQPQCARCPLQKGCLAFHTDTQALYPEKKIKKEIPTKHTRFLLLHDNEARVYLEKNPSSGIWGGLWCLPQVDMAVDPKQHLRVNYGLHPEAVHAFLQMKHTFSHFHLHIDAVRIPLYEPPDRVLPGAWLSAKDLEKKGLAKPVSVILEHFFAHS